jgi:excisionase family DNA binding protein
MVLFIIKQMLEEAGESDKKKLSKRGLISVTLYAKRVGVHRQTVINWVRSGKLKHTRTPSGQIRIDPSAEPTDPS